MEKFFVFLILLELVVCQFDTGSNTCAAFKIFFNYFEIFIIAVFAIEYVLRVFTIDKLRNIFRPFMMVDLLTILPVTGLIFILVVGFSSVFMCVVEQTTSHLALKKMPPSSLWSVITFIIYSYQGTLPIAKLCNFITSITPELGMLFQTLAVCILGALFFDIAMKKYNAFNLKKMTLREEPSFVDF